MIHIEFSYTQADFDSPKPYQELLTIADPFQQQITEEALTKYAGTLGVKTFKRRLRQFKESQKTSTAIAKPEAEITAFEDQELELDSGDWKTGESGVWKYGAMGGIEIACPHPITIKARLRNIDNGETKWIVGFRRGDTNRKAFSYIPIEEKTLSNAKEIIELSRIGISVTSERAKSLVNYFDYIMNHNYNVVPEKRSVSRLGWNEEGFSPYLDDVTFGGKDDFDRTFKAIGPHGSSKKWLEEASVLRRESLAARIILAASFASALVEPLGVLPFFVHLWGMDPGTGKTVGLMLAASVWGNPEPVGGPYIASFRDTSVSLEFLAGFLNSVPLVIDDLQLAKDYRGKPNFNVYELASGSGKGRGTKTLGVTVKPKWRNCMITSGETPLVDENDPAGAQQRVIEVECKADSKVVLDGHRTSGVLRANYGHAGKEFVYQLQQPTMQGRDDTNMTFAKSFYDVYFAACLGNKAVDKQAHSAALILTADSLAEMWLFKDKLRLTPDDIAEYLKTAESVSGANRGYAYVCDWVAQNTHKLKGPTSDMETYGMISEAEGYVYIIRSVFNRVCSEASISAQALLSHMKSKGLIDTRGRAYTIGKSFGGAKVECVALKMPTVNDLNTAIGENGML